MTRDAKAATAATAENKKNSSHFFSRQMSAHDNIHTRMSCYILWVEKCQSTGEYLVETRRSISSAGVARLRGSSGQDSKLDDQKTEAFGPVFYQRCSWYQASLEIQVDPFLATFMCGGGCIRGIFGAVRCTLVLVPGGRYLSEGSGVPASRALGMENLRRVGTS